MYTCHHYGCAFDCPLAPWNFDEKILAKVPRSEHRVSFLRRWIIYMRTLVPGYDRKSEPMWIYAQSRVGLGWISPEFGLSPLV